MRFPFLIVVCCNIAGILCGLNTNYFPKDFLFGVATSSYQIEGAWNKSGKGESVWDYFTHNYPGKIKDHSTADITCDSYHKIKEDVALLKELGVQFYRFSISWSRLLPYGFAHYINPDGIRYYNDLINELVHNGIKPMVTLYHWDLPLELQKLGGWTNPILVGIFEEYSKIAFENFGDRVPYWITFNVDCYGYGDNDFIPLINQPGVADYMCNHFYLKARARVYRLYDKEYRAIQKGQVGIVTFNGVWYEPKTNSKEDLAATQRAREFQMGWFASPLVLNGDYPEIMKSRIGYRSKMEGYRKSRLPTFSKKITNSIKGAYDFIAVNIYTTNLVSDIPEAPFTSTSPLQDIKVSLSVDPQWNSTATDWLKVVPSTTKSLLKWMKNKYGNITIIITENGYSDYGELQDHNRINFLQLYMSSLLDAIHEHQVKVIGFTVWSLMDNFEWNSGYTQKFGFYQVNFNDTRRTRTAKLSATFYKNVILNRKLKNKNRKRSLRDVHNYCKKQCWI